MCGALGGQVPAPSLAEPGPGLAPAPDNSALEDCENGRGARRPPSFGHPDRDTHIRRASRVRRRVTGVCTTMWVKSYFGSGNAIDPSALLANLMIVRSSPRRHAFHA